MQKKQKIRETIIKMKNSVNRLKEIALNKNVLTEDEYFDTLIEAEKDEGKRGWQGRVRQLEDMKTNNKLLKDIYGGKDAITAWKEKSKSTEDSLRAQLAATIDDLEKEQDEKSRLQEEHKKEMEEIQQSKVNKDVKYKVFQKKTQNYDEETESTQITIAVDKIAKGIAAGVSLCASGGTLAPILVNSIKNMVITMSWESSSKTDKKAEHFFVGETYLFLEIQREITEKTVTVLFFDRKHVVISAKVKFLYAEAGNEECVKELQEIATKQGKDALNYIHNTNAGGWE